MPLPRHNFCETASQESCVILQREPHDVWSAAVHGAPAHPALHHRDRAVPQPAGDHTPRGRVLRVSTTHRGPSSQGESIACEYHPQGTKLPGGEYCV